MEMRERIFILRTQRESRELVTTSLDQSYPAHKSWDRRGLLVVPADCSFLRDRGGVGFIESQGTPTTVRSPRTLTREPGETRQSRLLVTRSPVEERVRG